MFTYREMTLKDVRALAKLEKDNFPHPWSEESLRKEVDKEESLFVVAVENDNMENEFVAGYAGMYIIGEEGDITNVVTDSLYRGRGIGNGLMDYIVSKSQEIGIKSITLEVRVSNKAAIHMYKAHGFINEGIRPGFYDNPKEDAMIMWNYLPQKNIL